MKKFFYVIILCFLIYRPCDAANTYQVLCFHDVVPQLIRGGQKEDVTTERLLNYFEWLKANNFVVISVQDVIDATKGIKSLPPKSVMLTFDDGYESFYSYVFPLLKVFQYSATLAVVGSWLEVPEDGLVEYGDTLMPRTHFISIAHLKEISDSGLVEIASHSYDLHQGISGNPQNNQMPAATTMEFDQQTHKYEADTKYMKRITFDLQKNSDLIKAYIGKRPRVMVWPYGAYSGRIQLIANSLGMPMTMTLDDGINTIGSDVRSINRILLVDNPSLPRLVDELTELSLTQERVMHVDLDYIYDKDLAQQDINIDLLLTRVKYSGVSTVYLQAFADEDGDGVADSLYFYNHYLPIKADLFSKVSWELQTINNVKVYAWMPLLAFKVEGDNAISLRSVTSEDGSKGVGYHRLSPFSKASRDFIRGIYQDLARYNNFDGILIHDDATLSDHEDSSEDALNYYSQNWGLPNSIEQIRADPALLKIWTKHKTAFLSNFSNELRKSAEPFRKPLLLARNYFASVALDPNAETWFSQSVENGVANFDWVAIMAMPYMEGASDPEKWLSKLVSQINLIPGAKNKVLYELQAKDWTSGKFIPSPELVGWMKNLRIQGAIHFGYYPDDPITNEPNIGVIKRELSIQVEMP
ncbi:poly-beta-1,6-N-acetyl-D-glucosamine N-deacetylase PgaB [Polynucleobacter paneuropaeus]|nr:poly-beta-1,6-N-acetyl-D-glucosamine N-deacetylase PgaB [Polynucleobacter paneuropaeus]